MLIQLCEYSMIHWVLDNTLVEWTMQNILCEHSIKVVEAHRNCATEKSTADLYYFVEYKKKS